MASTNLFMSSGDIKTKIKNETRKSMKSDKKKAVIRATILGLATGVLFILAAQFVSLVITR